MVSDAVQIEIIRDISVLLGGVAATMGVAWISSRAPKKLEEKVAEIHVLVNDKSDAQIRKIDGLIAEVAVLKNAAAWKAGFKAAEDDGSDDKPA